MKKALLLAFLRNNARYIAKSIPAVATVFVLLALCSAHCAQAAPKNNGVPKDTALTKKANSGLPVTLQAYGQPYTIKKYKVEKDGKGNTKIVLIGDGFGMLSFNPVGQERVAIWCNFISGGKEFKATSIAREFVTNASGRANGGNSVYVFDTSAEPEILVLYPGDDPKHRGELQVPAAKR